MIRIEYGKEHGDCTSDYIVTTDCNTVNDFIEEWISTQNNEWGYFGIKNDKEPFFGDPCCKYKYGKIEGDPLPKIFLNKKIKNVTGSGGWSRSDFMFEVEDIKRKRFKVWELDDDKENKQ